MCSWLCKSCCACCCLLPAFRGRRSQQPAMPTGGLILSSGDGCVCVCVCLRKALKQASFLLGRHWQTVSSFLSAGSGARLQQAGMWHRWAPWPGRQCQDSTLFAAALTQLSQLCAVAPQSPSSPGRRRCSWRSQGKGSPCSLLGTDSVVTARDIRLQTWQYAKRRVMITGP